MLKLPKETSKSSQFSASDCNMDLTLKQIELLNHLLPARYRIELPEQKLLRTSQIKQRRPESDPIVPVSLPEKRVAREKEPEFLIGQPEAFKKCYRHLQALKRNPLSQRFLAPADTLGTPDHIEDYIDLNTIENKLITGEYLSVFHLAKDFRKMLHNCFQYNAKDPKKYLEIADFSRSFESLFKGTENQVFTDSIILDLNKKIEKLSEKIKELQLKVPVVKPLKDKKLSQIEKKQLCQSLKKLEPKYLNGVLKIVKGCMNTKGDELEFDLEKLPNKVCRELDRYIRQCLQVKPAQKKGIDIGRSEAVVNYEKKANEIKSESSVSSSLSSESEDEMPGAPLDNDLWGDGAVQDFTNGISIDFEKY